jgi:hypothetical protein
MEQKIFEIAYVRYLRHGELTDEYVVLPVDRFE